MRESMGEKDESLANMLSRYACGSAYPMHMPGHKRNVKMLGCALPFELDITEIEGFDDLHAADGILEKAMERAARVYQSRRSFFLVNGSTCGLLAGIRALTRRGDKVLVAQNAHRAVFHALELCGLWPIYIAPSLDASFGVLGSIDVGDVSAAMNEHPEVRLMLMTSPTYEGVVSDVRAIADVLHAQGIPLLVDEAHGAHFGFAEGFPESALSCGADIVIQSLHKTLPSLTQTAIAHVCGQIADDQEMARQLSIFESSSPSYVLMASIDQCVRFLEREGPERLRAHKARLERFTERIKPLRHLRVLCHGRDDLSKHPNFFNIDPSKLVVSARGTELSGEALMRMMREDYHFELEMCMGDWALAMTGLCDSDDALIRFADALLHIDARITPSAMAQTVLLEKPRPMIQAMHIEQALYSPGQNLPLHECVGKISKEYVWAYPPGIPILAPGVKVEEESVRQIRSLSLQSARLRSTRNLLPNELYVC